MPENVRSLKLLAIFNTLEEDDKDIAITVSESLVKKYQRDKKICSTKGNSAKMAEYIEFEDRLT